MIALNAERSLSYADEEEIGLASLTSWLHTCQGPGSAWHRGPRPAFTGGADLFSRFRTRRLGPSQETWDASAEKRHPASSPGAR